jgi:N-terminal half of MaoC dehydratase
VPFTADLPRVQDFLDSIGEERSPFRLDRPSPRFGGPLLPPTYLAQVRTTADPDLALPRYGSALNAGNQYRWLAAVHPGEPLERKSRVVEAYVRKGSSGTLTFIVIEMTLRRPGGEVVATGRATTVHRRRD